MKQKVVVVLAALMSLLASACATRVERDGIVGYTDNPALGPVLVNPNSNYAPATEKACAELMISSDGKFMPVHNEHGQFLTCMPASMADGNNADILMHGIWQNKRQFAINVVIRSNGNPLVPGATLTVPPMGWADIKPDLMPGTYFYEISSSGGYGFMFANSQILESGKFRVDAIRGNAYADLAHRSADFVLTTQ